MSEQDARRKHAKRLSDLREKTHKRIDFHLSKGYVDAGAFYHLVREFFMELLEKSYQPTYEELIDEISEIEHEFLIVPPRAREQVKELLESLSRQEYSGQAPTQEQLKETLARLKALCSVLTSNHADTIDSALQRARAARDAGDLDAARASYREARDLYGQLMDAERDQYLKPLQDLYSSLSPSISR